MRPGSTGGERGRDGRIQGRNPCTGPGAARSSRLADRPDELASFGTSQCRRQEEPCGSPSTSTEGFLDKPRVVPLMLLALILGGGALRLIVASQELFADELATYWVVSTHGLTTS